MTFRRSGATALATAVVVGVLGCNSKPLPTDGERFPFIEFGADFVGFRSWTSQTVESAVAAGSTHVTGQRTVYINAQPPPGATAFPPGTIIVKETHADGKIFARVKRGGGYNSTGAVDWEWFEIEETTGTAIVVIWHGVGPPAGEMYGGDPNAGCNTCHRAVPANDYVLSSWLALSPALDGAVAGDGGADEGGSSSDGGLAGDGGTVEGDANDAPDGSDVD